MCWLILKLKIGNHVSTCHHRVYKTQSHEPVISGYTINPALLVK